MEYEISVMGSAVGKSLGEHPLKKAIAEIKTKTEEWTQTVEVQETERKVATEALEAQKKCVI